MSESDDDIPGLSADTFAALQEFYAEQVSIGNYVERIFVVNSKVTKRQITIMYP